MSKERPFFFSFFGFLLILSSLGTQSLAADTVTPNQTIEDGATLVSSLGRFELGFFSPGASKNRYLGIWYKSTPGVIVWVANRNNPITNRGGAFTIGDSGDLVVLNRTKSIIWSSNVSATVSDPVGQLLETGNLVLKDNSRNANGTTESYVWQSFDQPSDTFLPGMKLGWNLKTHRETYLTSWRSVDDPSPGDFTYRLEIQALPQLVIASGQVKKYRTGPWNGFFFGGTPLLQNSVFNLTVVDNNEEVYYSYGLLNNSVLTRSTLNQTGTEQRYLKYDSWNTWTAIYSMPFDMCDNYGHCGANGFCRPSSNPTCLCLVGFATASPENLDLKNWTGSTFTCERKSALDCKKGEGFVKFEVGKFPDMIDFQWNESMNSEECEAACLRNCSCTAYANLNMTGTGKGCMMWSGDLIDAREVTGLIKQELYIRVSASELESLNGSSNKKRMKIIIAASLGTICFIILGIIICAIRRKRKSKASKQSGVEDVEVPLFDFNVVAASTNNFSDDSIIGAGGFGTVYKGKLSTGQEIAVKRLSKGSGQGVEEFRNEVTLIAKLQHRNLVGLLGSCIRGEERMLIYEYMPNKSLDYFLFDREKGATLLWKERFNIVLGIARGLLYLHQDSKLHVVHRDLKASNILLDSNLNPKISDFGLARIFEDGEKQATTQRVVGTYGYMSPEYTVDGTFSVKSDVFSLGVLLLEIVSGKRNRGFFQTNHHHTLPGHAWLLWKEGRALELVDPVLEDSYVASQLLRCIQVGLLCVQKLPEDRPAMLSVVFMLANEGALLSQPKQPGFFIERSSTMDSATRKEESFTANALTITVLEGR